MWNHITKNFQVKHGQCDSIISPKHFLLKALSNFQIFALLTAGLFTFDGFWNLFTNLSKKSMSCNTYFLSGGLIKGKGGAKLFQSSEKERLFISYDNQVLLGIISQCDPPLEPSKKGLPLLFTLAKKRTYLDTQLKWEYTDLFWKLPGCSLFHQAE